MKINCTYCNKEFSRDKSRVKENNYCSQECYHNNNKGKQVYNYNSIEIECTRCGEIALKPKWQIEAYKNHYCSFECFILYKKENAKYEIKNIVELARGLHTSTIWRKEILKRDNHTCQECGNIENLEVHHKKSISSIIRGQNMTNIEEIKACDELWDINNGITLCVKCHAEKHSDVYFINERLKNLKDE